MTQRFVHLEFYQQLEVPPTASQSEIKKAYHKVRHLENSFLIKVKAAIKYHPDKNVGNVAATEKFQSVKEAYEVLGNEEKRKLYDAYGKEYLQHQQNEAARQEYQQNAAEANSQFFHNQAGPNFNPQNNQNFNQNNQNFNQTPNFNQNQNFNQTPNWGGPPPQPHPKPGPQAQPKTPRG